MATYYGTGIPAALVVVVSTEVELNRLNAAAEVDRARHADCPDPAAAEWYFQQRAAQRGGCEASTVGAPVDPKR